MYHSHCWRCPPGESGTGKSAILKHMLRKLGEEGGASVKPKTILGAVLNFTDKSQALLDNISSLTKVGADTAEGKRSPPVTCGSVRQLMGVTVSFRYSTCLLCVTSIYRNDAVAGCQEIHLYS